MKTQTFMRVLGKTFAVAIAAVGVLLNIPTYAESASTTKASNALLSQADRGNQQAKTILAQTIVDIAASDSNFQTLFAAVKAADLV